MSGKPVQDLVMKVDSPVLAQGLKMILADYVWKTCTGSGDEVWTVQYWHRGYKIILADYEWKPCTGPGDASGQIQYWHRVYLIMMSEYE
jgi:hypothetical protein